MVEPWTRWMVWCALLLASSACGPSYVGSGGSSDGESAGGPSGDSDTEDGPDDVPPHHGSCPPPPADLVPVPEGQAASTQAAEACMVWVDCLCDGRSHETVPSCRHAANMGFEHLQDQAVEHGLTYDGRCLALHVRQLRELGCDQADPTAAWAIFGPGRCAIYHGDRTIGQRCTALRGGMSDCAQGLACWSGRCIDPCQARAVGPRCGHPYNFACAPDRVCEFRACVEPVGIGETCGPCGPDAWCKSDGCGRECPGTCEPVRPLGAACSLDVACETGFCLDGVCADHPVTGEACVERCFGGRECIDGVCGPAEGSVCTTTEP